MLWFAISVKDNFVLDAQPREYLALWGLRVLPDKLWCPLGIACSDLRNPLVTEGKRENKRKSEKKRDTTTEADLFQIAQKTVQIRDNNIRAY